MTNRKCPETTCPLTGAEYPQPCGIKPGSLGCRRAQRGELETLVVPRPRPPSRGAQSPLTPYPLAKDLMRSGAILLA